MPGRFDKKLAKLFMSSIKPQKKSEKSPFISRFASHMCTTDHATRRLVEEDHEKKGIENMIQSTPAINQFHPSEFSAITGAEIPASLTLRPLLLFPEPLESLPLLPHPPSLFLPYGDHRSPLPPPLPRPAPPLMNAPAPAPGTPPPVCDMAPYDGPMLLARLCDPLCAALLRRKRRATMNMAAP